MKAPAEVLRIPSRYAMSFDGIDDYVRTPSQTLSPPLTLEAWINYGVKYNCNLIMANTGAGYTTKGFRFFVNRYLTEDRRLVIEAGDGVSGSCLESDVNAIKPHTWRHGVAVIDGENSKLYLDGKEVASGTLLSFTQTSVVDIGQTVPYGFQFKGLIALARIYNRALTADEVKHHYEATKPLFA